MENLWEQPQFVDLLERQWHRSEAIKTDVLESIRDLCAGFDVQGASVLDVGCGVGRLSRFFKKASYQGIDGSAEMVNRCNERGIHATQSNIYALPFADQSIELVINNAVLYHIADIPRAVHELWRVAGKRLVFTSYWRPSLPMFWHNGPRPAFYEDEKTGANGWSVANIPPAWMIRRLVSKYLKPRQARFIWKDRRKTCGDRSVIVILDK